MVRGHLRRRDHSLCARAPDGLHRFPGGEVEQMQGLPLVGRKREVAFDHQTLGDRRIAGESELGRDRAFVHLALT